MSIVQLATVAWTVERYIHKKQTKEYHIAKHVIDPYSLSLSNFLQLLKPSVKDIRVTTMLIAVGILPDGVGRPIARDRRGRRVAIRGEYERTGAAKAAGVSGAGLPPVGGGVDQGVDTGCLLIRIDEVFDPGNHVFGAFVVAGGTVWVVFDIEHTGQCDAVLGPAATVLEEEFRLLRARGGVGKREMVASANQTGVGSALIM